MKKKMPSPDSLALIAATITRNTKADPEEAVEYALKLWETSVRALTLTGRYWRDARRQNHKTIAEAGEFKNIPQPKSYPASLDEFLKKIVKRSSKESKMETYKRFLKETLLPSPKQILSKRSSKRLLSKYKNSSEKELEQIPYGIIEIARGTGYGPDKKQAERGISEKELKKEIEFREKTGFKNQDEWNLEAGRFNAWRKVDISRTNAKSAKKRK